MSDVWSCLSAWRTTVVRDREIIDALVHPTHREPSEQLRSALAEWPGVHYWADGDEPGRLVLIRALSPPQRERWGLHLGLFLLTFLTVWIAGTYLAGHEPLQFFPVAATVPAVFGRIVDWIAGLFPGTGFAVAFMGILLAHEFGHYVVARRYLINASPPYFLPAPPLLTLIGTFGAFIRVRSPIVDRRQLIDVGAAGPWAGVAVALVALIAGLAHSQVVPSLAGPGTQLILWGGQPYYLGDSLIMNGARRLLVGEGTVLLHPLAFAGWLGLLVTMLNLLPLGQLDGGHIGYAILGERQVWVARLMWYGLLVLGLRFYWWYIWAALTIALGRGRLGHPSVLDRYRPLPPSRKPLGWATAILFIVTFVPVPFPGHFVLPLFD